MLHAGLDLSRNRIDVCLMSEHGEVVAEFASPSDADGVGSLARRVLELGEPGIIPLTQGKVSSILVRDGRSNQWLQGFLALAFRVGAHFRREHFPDRFLRS